MDKNFEFESEIVKMTSDGKGIAVLDGLKVFIPFTAIGDYVRAKIILKKKNFAIGKVLEIIKPSASRVEPHCPVFSKCGGCNYQHIEYNEQLMLKLGAVKEALKKNANIDYDIKNIVKSDKIYEYRNKLQMPMGESNGQFVMGFYAPNSHRIIDCNECVLHSDWTKTLIKTLREYQKQFKVSAYNEEKGTGILRHLVARKGKSGVLITIVINAKSLPKINELVKLLDDRFESYGLNLNINMKKSNLVLGDEFIFVKGLKALTEERHGIITTVNSQSFLQVNDEMCEKLYSAVSDKIDDNNDVIINAYSGAGLLTAILAKKAKYCYGVEIIKAATECADELKNANGLNGRMCNITDDCALFLPKLVRRVKSGKFITDFEDGEKSVQLGSDWKKLNKVKEIQTKTKTEEVYNESAIVKATLVLDPPRKGIEKSVIDAILEALPDKVIYISCNPQTLARDLGILLDKVKIDANGQTEKKDDKYVNTQYDIESIELFDMFPQTAHVETLVVLKKK